MTHYTPRPKTITRRMWVLAILAGCDRVMRPSEIADEMEDPESGHLIGIEVRRLESLGLAEPILPGGRTVRRPGRRVVAYGYRITDKGRQELKLFITEIRLFEARTFMSKRMAELVGVTC